MDAGALADLARSYNVSKGTISRATRARTVLAALVMLAGAALPFPSRARPAPAPVPVLRSDSLARAFDRVAALRACITPSGGFDAACVRRTLASLPPDEAAAFALFGAFDAFYGEQDHRRDGDDYPWALGR